MSGADADVESWIMVGARHEIEEVRESEDAWETAESGTNYYEADWNEGNEMLEIEDSGGVR